MIGVNSSMSDDFQLTVAVALRHMSTVHADSTVVTVRDEAGSVTRHRFSEIADMASALAARLQERGMVPGEMVATLAWNSAEHLAAYFAVPASGLVLHTANPRLSPANLVYTLNDAGSKVLIFDESLRPVVDEIRDQLPSVEFYIVIGRGAGTPTTEDERFEDFVGHGGTPEWPDLDERAAAAVCYTSGTTGSPKGVVYSHRALILHALGMQSADGYGITANDRVLTLVPMFHAMAWNIPFVCALNGADVILPNRFLDAADLVRLIEAESVSYSLGVPTLWTDVARVARKAPERLATLGTVVSGGSNVPSALIDLYDAEFDVSLVQGWGMTETLPGAAVAHRPRPTPGGGSIGKGPVTGRVTPLYEMRVMTPAGDVAPWDGQQAGELQVRGPVVARAYHNVPSPQATERRPWFATGDVGTIGPGGWVRLSDRVKDVIKSGGEWISSVEIEECLLEHAEVVEAAVVAQTDDRWGERPYAFVVVAPGVDCDALRTKLADDVAARMPRWWVPDTFEMTNSIPKTSVGKIDKKALRQQLVSGA